LADEALSVLMGGHGHGGLGLVRVWFLLRMELTSLPVQDEGDPYSLPPTPDDDDVLCSAGSTSLTPFTPCTSIVGSCKVKAEAASKTPSRASTPKSRPISKRTLQEAFAEGSAKENQMFERMGTQKHERAIGELELKRRKLENKAMEKQHQCEREREQHEFRMMKMRMMMSQNQQAAPMMMQSQNPSSFEGLGLMAELNDTGLPSESSASLSPYPV
jgi:hypothetical protein